MYQSWLDGRVILLQHEVTETDDNSTVSHILRGRLRLSQRLYRRLKRENGIFVNTVPVRVNHVVQTGDSIVIATEPEDNCDTIAEEMNLDIVYEDNWLILLNKPPGICVHPTHGHWTGTLANGVAQYFINSGVPSRVRPVHRLDMDTSGLVLFAKTQLSHQKLAEQLDGHDLGRRYLALVSGVPHPHAGIVTGAIARSVVSPKERHVSEMGRSATTHYRVMQEFGDVSLVELVLETGRTHQIRVHMAHIGHPLLGDRMYNDGCPWTDCIPRQALHAYCLEFRHPDDNRQMAFTIDIPEDMKTLLAAMSCNRRGPDR